MIISPEKSFNKRAQVLQPEKAITNLFASDRREVRASRAIYETPDGKFVVIMGVRVKKAAIPQASREPEDFKMTSTSLRLLRDIAVAYNARVPILLSGDSGIGKTAALRKFAELIGAKLHLVNVNEDTTIRSLMTKPAPVGSGFDYVDGPLTEAFRAKPGEVHLIVLDEINTMRSEQASGLHAILDAWQKGGEINTWKPLGNGKYERISVPQEGVYFSMTMNPLEEGYNGRKQIDNALARRCHLSQHGRADGTQMREMREIAAGKEISVSDDVFLYSRKVPLSHSELMRDRDYEKLHNAYIRFHETLIKKINDRELGQMQFEGTYFGGIDMNRRVHDFLRQFYAPENGSLTEVWRKALEYYYVQPFMNAEDRARVREMITMFVKEDAPDAPRSGGQGVSPEGEYMSPPKLHILSIDTGYHEYTVAQIYQKTKNKPHAGKRELDYAVKLMERHNNALKNLTNPGFTAAEENFVKQFKKFKYFNFLGAAENGEVPFIKYTDGSFSSGTQKTGEWWATNADRLVLLG